jgi:hypothetical protein
VSNIPNILLVASLLGLVVTKAADFITTLRHVGPEAESNPLARWCFRRCGFKGGLVLVAIIWMAIVLSTYVSAFQFEGLVPKLLTAIVGSLIAWAQWEAARFNSTRRHSRFIRAMLRFYYRIT